MGIALALIIIPLPEPSARHLRKRPHVLSRPTWGLIVRLMVTNATKGLSVGFLGPIMVLRFHVRYGADSGQIVALYTVTNLCSIVSYFGVVRAV